MFFKFNYTIHRIPIVNPTPTIEFRLGNPVESNVRVHTHQLKQEPELLLAPKLTAPGGKVKTGHIVFEPGLGSTNQAHMLTA